MTHLTKFMQIYIHQYFYITLSETDIKNPIKSINLILIFVVSFVLSQCPEGEAVKCIQ